LDAQTDDSKLEPHIKSQMENDLTNIYYTLYQARKAKLQKALLSASSKRIRVDRIKEQLELVSPEKGVVSGIPQDLRVSMQNDIEGLEEEIKLNATLIAKLKPEVKSYKTELKKIDPRRKLTKKLIEETKKAYTDSLTQINEHNYFKLETKRLFEKCRREKKNCSMIMIDLDFFKASNEVGGHQYGDVVLKKSALILKEILEEAELPEAHLLRLDGINFSIVIPDKTTEEVEELAQKINETYKAKMAEFCHQFDEQKTGDRTLQRHLQDWVKDKKPGVGSDHEKVNTVTVGVAHMQDKDADIFGLKDRAKDLVEKQKEENNRDSVTFE